VLVNNIDIKNFKAKLMSRNISSAEVDIFNYWGTNSINPLFFKRGKRKFKVLEMTLDLLCNNDDELETMKSNLINKLESGTIKFEDIDYYYRGFINGEPSFKYIMKGNEIADIKMLVIAEKAQVTETMNRVLSKTINVIGNTETPAIVEVTPSIDLIDLTINGLDEEAIILKNLKANKKLIVNGEEGTVTVDGINKYGDTDMWGFPRLKPGANTITVSKNNVDITIKYKPRFI
jgi:phage-related protein